MGTYLLLQNQQNKSKPFSSLEALVIFEKGYHVVLIIYCCVSNYHKFVYWIIQLVTWNNNIYCSFYRSRLSFVLYLGRVSHRLKLELPVRAMVSSPETPREGFTPKLPDVAERIQLLMNWWTESLSVPSSVGWRLYLVPCHVGLSNMAACLINTKHRWQQRELRVS